MADNGSIHQGRELRQLRPELVGHAAPLLAGGFGVVLSEGRGHEGGHDPPPALAGMGQRIAHEVPSGAVEEHARKLLLARCAV